MFTVTQTDGEPLPPVEVPGWDLDRALDGMQIRQVSFDELSGNVQGYSYDRNYAINPVAADPVHTTFHEIGHIVLGHTAKDAQAEYSAHRGIKEFQAEAIAYLAMNELELITPESASHPRGYIQGWLRDESPTDVAIRQVFSATDTVLKAGRTHSCQPLPGEAP